MNLNVSNLSHPRTAWSLEAAMFRAIESKAPIGRAEVETASGKHLMTVIHRRNTPSAFRFYACGTDVTDKVLKALRSQA